MKEMWFDLLENAKGAFQHQEIRESFEAVEKALRHLIDCEECRSSLKPMMESAKTIMGMGLITGNI